MTDNVQDLTLQVLRQIRDEIVSTRVELRAEIAQTNERLGHVETTLQDLAAASTRTATLAASVAPTTRTCSAAELG